MEHLSCCSATLGKDLSAFKMVDKEADVTTLTPKRASSGQKRKSPVEVRMYDMPMEGLFEYFLQWLAGTTAFVVALFITFFLTFRYC